MPPDPFGTWLPCYDGAVHYFLPGCDKPLCRKSVAPTGEPCPRVKIGRAPHHCGTTRVLTADCRRCRTVNGIRWGEMYQTPEPAAAAG